MLPRKSGDTFDKPICDDRSYELIRLDNDLEVLLVHDPNATRVSAAVDINVGSIRVQCIVRKYYNVVVVMLLIIPVDGVESAFGYSPLLYYHYWPVSKFRDRSTKLLSRKNIAPKFKDIKRKKTLCWIYPDKVGGSI
jgi:hypothetical protein